MVFGFSPLFREAKVTYFSLYLPTPAVDIPPHHTRIEVGCPEPNSDAPGVGLEPTTFSLHLTCYFRSSVDYIIRLKLLMQLRGWALPPLSRSTSLRNSLYTFPACSGAWLGIAS